MRVQSSAAMRVERGDVSLCRICLADAGIFRLSFTSAAFAAVTLPPVGGEGRATQRSCGARGGGATLTHAPVMRRKRLLGTSGAPTPDPSPPLASLARGGECRDRALGYAAASLSSSARLRATPQR